MAAVNASERAEAVAKLRELLPPGATVCTILRHVSRSGMSRSISVVVDGPDGPTDVDWLVRKALGMTFDRNHAGLKVSGCGMDMGFYLVYNLSATLYPQGFGCIGDRCPSNDHSNGMPRETVAMLCAPAHTPVVHKSGGYALRHRWL